MGEQEGEWGELMAHSMVNSVSARVWNGVQETTGRDLDFYLDKTLLREVFYSIQGVTASEVGFHLASMLEEPGER